MYSKLELIFSNRNDQIDKKKMKATGMTKRVQEEVKIHWRLKHPSVLELYTFFEDKNYVYLVLELCHNGEIQNYLNKKPQQLLDEDETRHFLKQIVDGMLYLHSHGILHRDLALKNLLLTKEMNVVSGLSFWFTFILVFC